MDTQREEGWFDLIVEGEATQNEPPGQDDDYVNEHTCTSVLVLCLKL